MKCLLFYAYPPEPDGQSLQGHSLYLGIKNLGIEAIPCHFQDSIQKQYYLKYLKPDVAFGIGFWGNVPDVVKAPLKYGVTPVPWFNADGWVANYKKEGQRRYCRLRQRTFKNPRGEKNRLPRALFGARRIGGGAHRGFSI